MKKINLSYKKTFLVFISIFIFSCHKTNQRDETIDQDIAGQLIEIDQLKDVSSADKISLFVQDSQKASPLDLNQAKYYDFNAELSKVINVIGTQIDNHAFEKIKNDLIHNPISILILPQKLIIYKVVQNSTNNQQEENLLLKDLLKLKIEALEHSEATSANNLLRSKLEYSNSDQTTQYIEIASINVIKTGILENKKTKYYDEKMSVLTLTERPFDLSTHLLLEVKDTEASGK